MEKKWKEMSADEKQEELFQRWLSPQGVNFVSHKAEKAYKERVTRIKDAIQLKKLPDRVPVLVMVCLFPAFYAGVTPKEAMYDYDKVYMAWKKYVMDFQPDAHPGLYIPAPGRVLEALDAKLYAWPDHGTSANHTFQCIEKEYVMADEYDAMMADPSQFFCNTYLPRIYGALAAFKELPSHTAIANFRGLVPYGLPEVQAAYKALFEAGNEALKWSEIINNWDNDMAGEGFPNFFCGTVEPPFDRLGNTLRGPKGIVMDIYRQPGKLLEALEAITPIIIKQGVAAAKATGRPVVFVPLCKGDDSFLSEQQYKTFYWPTFRKLIIGLVEEGCIPFCMAHGGYNSRLEIIKDVPEGKTIWVFDLTDMAKAKEILGDTACIGGNLPIDLLTIGTAREVKACARKLIDTVGKGGGYIMVNGAGIDEAKPENVKAMIDFTKEYGVYR